MIKPENEPIQEEPDKTSEALSPLSVEVDDEYRDYEYVTTGVVHGQTVYQTLNSMSMNNNMSSSSQQQTNRRPRNQTWESVRSKSPGAASFLENADKFPMYVPSIIPFSSSLHIIIAHYAQMYMYVYIKAHHH